MTPLRSENEAAERREQQRRRVAQHRGEQRRPHDDALEVADARLRRGDAAGATPTTAGTHRAPAEPRSPAADRDRTRRRPRATPSMIVGTGERIVSGGTATKNGEEAERDAGPAGARGRQPAAVARSARRAGRSATACSCRHRIGAAARAARRNLPAQLPQVDDEDVGADEQHHEALDDAASGSAASAGSKTSGSRLRTDVPVSSAPNSSAENSVPTAVLRPSRATAMPRKPTSEIWTSLVATRNCQPSTSSEPASPANSAADRHHEHVVAADRDARRPRRLGVEADRADLEAGARAVEDHPEHEQHRERDEQADVQALQLGIAPEHRQLGPLDDVVGHRHRRVGVALQRAAEAEQEQAAVRSRSS